MKYSPIPARALEQTINNQAIDAAHDGVAGWQGQGRDSVQPLRKLDVD
ncbi:MAG: hypothetical protein P9L94_06465 [Candidatus Hinthialibacter antarcticus]|nr:hypothetical protein [Candidatus Hinthialibacter antarcticus]